MCFEGADIAATKGELHFELHAGTLSADDKTPLP